MYDFKCSPFKASKTQRNMKNYTHLKLGVTSALALAATAFTAQGALVGHYKFEETSGVQGSAIADSSGNNLNGSLQVGNTGGQFAQSSVAAGTYGSIVVSASTATGYGTSLGLTGAARSDRFNIDVSNPTAYGNLVTSGSGASDGFGTFTVMAWVNTYANGLTQRIFSTGNPSGWSFAISDQDLLYTNFGGADNIAIASPKLTAGSWYHVAMTYSNNALEFFVNGNSTATVANAGNFNEEVATGFRIGSTSNGGEQFDGRMDELKIFDNVLSVSEIRANAVPEPSSAILGGIGLLAFLRRRR